MSSDKRISIGVPQGSILAPILFILFINDFHKAVKFSTVHHVVDDTSLLPNENSLKKLNKRINRDLKLVAQWMWANKSLTTGKKKTVILKNRNRKLTKHLNFYISVQKIVPVYSVKYLGLTLQSDLAGKHTWQVWRKTNRKYWI